MEVKIEIDKPPSPAELKLFIQQMGVTREIAAKCASVTSRTIRRYLEGVSIMPVYRWVFMRRNVFQYRIEASKTKPKKKRKKKVTKN